MIDRIIEKSIKEKLFKGKVIILIGPRQVGKTTLLKKILEKEDCLLLDGDESIVRTSLENASAKILSSIIGNNKIVFIDEAQRIENVGLTAKIIHDQFPEIQLILSGSSSFELRNKVNEPLTGRKWTFNLFPISYEELETDAGYLEAKKQFEIRLIYGFYPDVINHPGEEQVVLNEIAESYLFKDILSYGNIQKPEILEKILRALAFQVGNEVNYSEIAQLVGVDKNTVSKYIYLLELSYVIFPLPSFSRNLRSEIKTNKKFYFYDNGIRNALIHNYNPIGLRDDIGALWENFLIVERLKQNHYHNNFVNSYFWRTMQQQEIDYIEEEGGKLSAFEFKWNPKSKVKIPSTFVNTYNTKVDVVHHDNFRVFLGLA